MEESMNFYHQLGFNESRTAALVAIKYSSDSIGWLESDQPFRLAEIAS
jgi:hypothetical protein